MYKEIKPLAIQEFLRTTDNAIPVLQEKYGIYAKRSVKHPSLIQFHYDQIESSGSEIRSCQLVMECRGIILDESDNWKVVAYPFNRFFNSDEPCAAKINWGTATVQEKLDGSLMILYWYGNMWNVATKGSPDAAGTVGTEDFTFADLFWKTFKKYVDIDKHMDIEHTYMVELVSNYNRVVCTYSEENYSDLYLIGIRSNLNYTEVNVNKLSHEYLVFPPPKTWPMHSIGSVMSAAKELNPMQQEGFVVVDGNFNRIKVKSPQYVLIHHMKDNFSTRRMIDLIKLGEVHEFLSYFPEYMGLYNKVKSFVDDLVLELTQEYANILEQLLAENKTTQKDFALLANKSRLPSVLYSVKAHKYSSIKDAVYDVATKKLEDMLG